MKSSEVKVAIGRVFAAIKKVFGTDSSDDDDSVGNAGVGVRGTPMPDEVTPGEGGTIPVPMRQEAVKHRLALNSLEQHDADMETQSEYGMPKMSLEEAMQTARDSVINWGETDKDVEKPVVQVGDVDGTLTDPSKPDMGGASSGEDGTET